jgi:fumarate hydratase subunit beta
MKEKTVILKPPLDDATVESLEAGDTVLITGVIYTARDAAHKRLMELIAKGEKLPFDIKGAIIYYVGPTPAPPGKPIGSAGPTTSGRMDSYAPKLIELGLKAMLGKGVRSEAVIEAMKKHKAVYLGATGGAGALLSHAIIKSEVVAYEDLGPEAIRKLEVVEFPAVVINDVHGRDLYKEGQAKYRKVS